MLTARLRPLAEKMLRRMTPRQVIALARFHRIFNHDLGHSKRVNGLAHDGLDRPVPWMTYPLIEFLRLIDLADCSVFEFGAGSSTLFWAEQAASVTSVEKDQAWYAKLAAKLPDHCELQWHPDDRSYVDALSASGRRYDIIVVDGSVRYPCAEAALSKLSERGLIILDNTEWYPNTARLITDAGFCQVDFSGFGPINAFTSTSSIFFRDPVLLSRRRTPPRWAPLGGRYLDAYDDCPFDKINPALID